MKLDESNPRRRLTLFDSVAIIVGIIIGAGIYQTSPQIAHAAGSPAWMLAAWAFGGLIALTGALCYAELCTAYPQQGGDYVYLRRAYGRPLGLLFGWCEFWIIRPASIGAMAFVFANYFQQLLPARLAPGTTTLAILAIAVLSLINLIGLRSGKWTQNVLTVVKVAGLLGVFAVGLWPAGAAVEPAGPAAGQVAAAEPAVASFGLAMILVLFTFGGWNEIAFVAAEVRHPQRNLLRSLVLGTLIVLVVYLLVNVAFWHALGFEGFRTSDRVASELLERALGPWGGRAISLLITISTLGAINGMIFTGARIYYALGTDSRLFGWLGRWNQRRGIPLRSLALQAAATMLLVGAFGRYEESFERLVVFSAPFFYFFLLLVGVSLFVLRRRDPAAERPYRVHGFPLTPLVFLASCLYMLYSTAVYLLAQDYVRLLTPEVVWSLAVVATGLALGLARRW